MKNDQFKDHDVVYRMTLRYQGKDYIVDGYCFYEEYGDGWGEWRTPHEMDGVRCCEHDYASYLPDEVRKDKEFGCDKKEIEIIDEYFFDKTTNSVL